VTEFSQGSEFGTRPEDIDAALNVLEAVESHNTHFTQLGIAAAVLEVDDVKGYSEERVLEDTAKFRAWIEDPARISVAEQQELDRDVMDMVYHDTLNQLGVALSPVRADPSQTLPTIQGDEVFGDVHLQLASGRTFVSFLRNIVPIVSGGDGFADVSSRIGSHFLTEFSYLMAYAPEDAHVTELSAHAGDIKEALELLKADGHIMLYLEEIRKHTATDTVYEWWYTSSRGLLVPPDVQLEYDIPGPASWHKSMNGHSLEFNWADALDLVESAKGKSGGQEFYEALATAMQESLTFAYDDWQLTLEEEHGSDQGFDEGVGEVFLRVQKRLSEIRNSGGAEPAPEQPKE